MQKNSLPLPLTVFHNSTKDGALTRGGKRESRITSVKVEYLALKRFSPLCFLARVHEEGQTPPHITLDPTGICSIKFV